MDKKKALHTRNRHHERYDLQELTKDCPELGQFVVLNKFQQESIDFSNPDAVKALNRAILKNVYGVLNWDIPPDYLCPPIPGRADYIHNIADLLASHNGDVVPRGKSVRVLDIGVGANCVHPLIGQSEYGWSFVGTDIDPTALDSARRIVDGNPGLSESIQLRSQTSPQKIFDGILESDETFDLVICNPPFHASLEEARQGSVRKWQNLGKEKKVGTRPVLNFGGKGVELCCEGGEVGFVRRMIKESAQIPLRCFWFSTILSRESHLPAIFNALERAHVVDSYVLEMTHGQKKSRIVAWTFLDEAQRDAWVDQAGWSRQK
jgi:23S rRNA (adenine1618-N6)-methyltransferase